MYSKKDTRIMEYELLKTIGVFVDEVPGTEVDQLLSKYD